MLLDGGAVSAASRNGKNQIRPAESFAPQRQLIHRQFPAWQEIAGDRQHLAGIPLWNAASEIECDPLTSEINARRPEPGAAGMPARRPRERSWDDDAIKHHMTLF